MIVKVHRNETSFPIAHDAISTYTKGPLYCVLIEKDGEKLVYKYPLCGIFRIVEKYE